MEAYSVGIDGGGTKTTAKILFHSSRPPVIVTSGPLNICSVGKAQVAETICQLTRQIEARAGALVNCKGIGIGVAGFTNPKTAPFLKEQIIKQTGCQNIQVVSDAHIVLCGALNASAGIVLIAGTGSICYGMNDMGQACQTGGAGHLIDDEGSGYAIGRDILSACAGEAVDGALYIISQHGD